MKISNMNWFGSAMTRQRRSQFQQNAIFPGRFRGRLSSLLVFACCLVGLFFMPDLTAGEQKDPTAPRLIVRDVSVFLVSAHGKKLNDAALFRSTTPGYMLSRRLSADASESDQPAPLGLITFEGPPVKDIDVLVEFPSGRFLSHWPTARIQSKRIYWRAQNLSKENTLSMQIPESHWLSHLQTADRLFVKGIDKCERFILYDVELNHTPRITLSHTKDGFQIQNQEAFPLKNVTVVQPTDKKTDWRLATVDLVPSPEKTEKKPVAKPTEAASTKKGDPLSDESLTKKAKVEQAKEKAKQLAALGNKLKEVGVLPSVSVPAAKAAEKSATPSLRKAPPVDVPFQSAAPLSREQVLAEWEKKLETLDLGQPEITHVLKILGQHAFREDQATIVYCMDESYLDKILPLEITPFPDVVRRTAIVILLDADPALLKRIDQLIVQLGDPKWEKRNEAQKKLEEYGKAAQVQLQKATKNKDLEIVFRAEQILEKIK
ncbi:hypothetical protein Enr17x_29960 [Gimesia fumaroli]|uniref:Uncharacterized protein n=2 Tax=Gimesia fumaroli TaxID=2527976 RepID=A0A518ICX3_9PLAN|nr:hypothetical protein Enr17x_29960 [Gimesia fumaroli]